MFRAETPYGVVQLPDLSYLSGNALRDLYDAMGQRDWFLIEHVASPQALAIIDQLQKSDLFDIFTQWQDHSGVSIEQLLHLEALKRSHAEGLEADLIDKGLRLRNCPSLDFNWRDLWVIYRSLVNQPSSNLYRSIAPDSAGWTLENQLLASIADSQHWLQWAKAGAKKGDMPKRIQRPGVVEVKRATSKAEPISVVKKRAQAALQSTPHQRKALLNNAFR